MTATLSSTDLRTKLPYLIHLGCVEIRHLAFNRGSYDQIAKLADVLEFLPQYIESDREPEIDVIREQFEQYATEFPISTYSERYLEFLDGMKTGKTDAVYVPLEKRA